MQLFLDMDGVLADFDTGYELAFGIRPSKENDTVDWKLVANKENFYQDLPPMEDMHILWEYTKKYNPIILTGIPWSVKEAPDNKKDWIKKHFDSNVEVRCVSSKDKCHHANPSDILIDDWNKYKNLWIEKGGLWITHFDALTSISKLQELGY